MGRGLISGRPAPRQSVASRLLACRNGYRSAISTAASAWMRVVGK
jgi:hypothetical protein